MAEPRQIYACARCQTRVAFTRVFAESQGKTDFADYLNQPEGER